MRRAYPLLLGMLLSASTLFAALPYQNPKLNTDRRVEDLMSRMTLDEKLIYLSGMRDVDKRTETPDKLKYIWDGTRGNDRLGIRPLKFYSGPYGANVGRYTDNKKTGIYYPSSINLAATWNRAMVEKVLSSLSKELTASGAQSNAGPSINIIRDLRGGRSMEYFTEDPYLNGQIAVSYVKGIKSQGNFAIMKHYLANNQERLRNSINVKVSERALREIYMPGYRAAVVEGGILGVMTGYNTVNDIHNASYKHTIQEVLKDEWGFKGMVMTDWAGSDTSTARMVNAGLDLEMPRMTQYKPEKLKAALDRGEIQMSQIEEMLRRILYVTFESGVMDREPKMDITQLSTAEGKAIAREAAAESYVLLKNDDATLPFDKSTISKIAVIGPNGEFGAHFRKGQKTYQMLQGGGSASIVPKAGDLITPYQGIKNAVTKSGKEISVRYEPGCYGEHGYTPIAPKYFTTASGKAGLDATYYSKISFEGTANKSVDKNIEFIWHNTPLIIEQGLSGRVKEFSAIWSGSINAPQSREYHFQTRAVGDVKLYIDDKLVLESSAQTRTDEYEACVVTLSAGAHKIKAEYSSTGMQDQFSLDWDLGSDEYLTKAIEAAKEADVVVLTVGTSGYMETESIDRATKEDNTDCLSLSHFQERLIREVAKVNRRVVVVTYTSGVTCEAWRESVPSILYAGFPGQEGANALGDIIFGDVNPSGKLTVTIPKSSTQYPESWYSFTKKISYDEGVYVGYRYFDKHKLEPAFAFGHGLSYTTFKYGKTTAKRVGDKWSITIPITNTGKRPGKEVVQLYVSDPKCSVDRPLKELKGFEKIDLESGETKTVHFTLDDEAFAFWSEKSNRWLVESGEFKICIGSASDDIRSSVKIKM